MAKLDMAIAIKYHWKLLKFQFLASLVPIKGAIFPTWLQCVYANFHVSTQVLWRVINFLSILSFNGAIGTNYGRDKSGRAILTFLKSRVGLRFAIPKVGMKKSG